MMVNLKTFSSVETHFLFHGEPITLECKRYFSSPMLSLVILMTFTLHGHQARGPVPNSC